MILTGANLAFEFMMKVDSLVLDAWANEVDGDTYFDMRVDPTTGVFYWATVLTDYGSISGEPLGNGESNPSGDPVFNYYQTVTLDDLDSSDSSNAAREALIAFQEKYVVMMTANFVSDINRFSQCINDAEREIAKHQFSRDGGFPVLNEGAL